MKKIFVTLFFTIAFITFSKSQSIEKEYEIKLKSGNYTPNVNKELTGVLSIDTIDKQYILVQFYKLLTKEEHDLLEKIGIYVLEYIPNNAYYLSISNNKLNTLIEQFKIRNISLIDGRFKIDPLLSKPELPKWALQGSDKIKLNIRYFEDSNLNNLISFFKKNNIDISKEDTKNNKIEIIAPTILIKSISELKYIAYISPISPPNKPLDDFSSSIQKANILTSTLPGYRNLDGTGITVGIVESAYIETHADFRKRLINLVGGYSSDYTHALSVGGIIGGNGNLNKQNSGIASSCTLLSYPNGSLIDNSELYYKKYNMVLTNNSYGKPSEYNGMYMEESRDIDKHLNKSEFSSISHIFSAGNEGNGATFGNVLGGYTSAKNTLTIGSHSEDSPFLISNFSSRGPTLDGRIKPEVVAQGDIILGTTYPDNKYGIFGGTSASAPVVTGVTSLLYQRYKQLNNVFPNSALIKAIISNSADDLGNPGPDYTYGFGKVNAKKAVESIESKNYFQGTLNAGNTTTYSISIPSNTVQFKVMLYWKDKEANENAAITLVNNLDLRLKYGANTFLPWILNTNNPSTLAVRGDDNINNIEQITIDNPASGSYSIEVNGSGIAMGSEEFIVVYQITQKHLQLTYPLGKESFKPNTSSNSLTESIRFQWEAAGNNSLTLEYSTNNGTTWNVIVQNLPSTQRTYLWNYPFTQNSSLLVRIKDGTLTSQTSESIYIIKEPIGLKASTGASNKIIFQWKSVHGASSYDVYLLNPYDEKIQLVASTTDSSYVFSNLQNTAEYWMSVRAKTNTGLISNRAMAIKHKISELNLCINKGSILKEYWTNILGDSVQAIPVNIPSTTSLQVNNLEGPTDSGDNYGVRYRGYLCPTMEGEYAFKISSNNDSELWLSQDEYVYNKSLVAYVKGWTNSREFNKYPEQISRNIYLKPGKAYYIEVLHKEGTLGDNLSVGWNWPDGRTEEIPIQGNKLTPFTNPVNNTLPTINITSPVVGQTFNTSSNITINANASKTDGTITKVVFYQGTIRLGEDITAPYIFIWNNVPAGIYSLTAKAYDNAGAVVTSSAINITVGTATTCSASGTILREYWSNTTGGNLSGIPFNTSPTNTSQLNIFEGPTNAGANYGSRIRGYICPPTTGAYTFWIASNDNSELYLSTNDNPANKIKIAAVTGYTSSRQWDKYAPQKSGSINLIGGTKYYIEAIHIQNGGTDNLAVGWQLPNGTQERPIPGNRLSSFSSGGTTNTPPIVSITSPTYGQSFIAPANIIINVNASDIGGSISKVEFFQGTTKIGEDVTIPYSLAWNNVSVGSYTITAKATDNGGSQTTSSPISISVTTGSTNCTSSGTILREYWAGVSGSTVALIPVNVPPSSSSQLSIFEGPTNAADNYGARYSGYICAPFTGAYTFWIASNDNGELWLSIDENPSNKVKIAFVSTFTNVRQWDKLSAQKSALINLVAGKKYYIEALHKEGANSDNFAVGWQLPNGTQERPIPGNRLSPRTSSLEKQDDPITLSLDEDNSKKKESSVKVNAYPNPINSGDLSLTIEGYQENQYKVFIEIMSLQGKTLYSDKVNCDVTCSRTIIPIDHTFPKGVYIIKVRIDGQVYTEKLLID